MRSIQPDTEPALPRSATLRVLLRFYVLPVVVGALLSIMLVSWLLVIVGISIWTTSVLAALIAAVATILTEEVVYDE